jgi:1-acyl-sn-glycerol-3-phosphate acyltransferase
MYGLGRVVSTIVVWLFGRPKVIGRENLPVEGGFILCANHVSYIDPPSITAASTRVLRFMAKSELFAIPLLGKIIAATGTFPVKRGAADRTAIRTAVELLQSGQVVCMFPEGKRSLTGHLLPPEPGVGVIALRAQMPVIPAALIGTARLLPPHSPFPRFSRIKVVFGKPIDYSDLAGNNGREAVNEMAQRIMVDIQKLIDENSD